MGTGRGGSQACGPTWSCANQEEIRATGAQGLQKWEAGEAVSGPAWKCPASHVRGWISFCSGWRKQRVLKVESDGQIFCFRQNLLSAE